MTTTKPTKSLTIGSVFASLKIGGGVEQIQANISRVITKAGHKFVHIVCKDDTPRNPYEGKIISLERPFIKGYGLKKIRSLIRDAYQVARIANREKIDIMIGQGDYFFMVTGLAKWFGMHAKTRAIVHTTIAIWHPLIVWLLKFFLHRNDLLVFTAKQELETFRDVYKFPAHKLKLIYNAIDTDAITQRAKEPVSKVSFEAFTFINIARLSYQKGQSRLLRAFERVHERYPDSQLLILGDGELRDELRQQHETLSSQSAIHFLGNCANIYPYLTQADCFVLSSRFEGFPMVLIEALCVGIPIVSTDCPTGPREILGNGGGILVPYTDEEIETPLVEAMIRMIEDDRLRKQYQQEAKKQAEYYSLAYYQNKWVELIKHTT